VTFFAYMYAGEVGGPPDLAQRKAALIGLLGLVSVCAGFVMMGIESHRPYTRTWTVDQVQYVNDGRDLLVVNYRDDRGLMQPQYRQLLAPQELADLLQEVAGGEKVPIVVTVQPGESHKIVQVKVLRDRLSLPEVHNF